MLSQIFFHSLYLPMFADNLLLTWPWEVWHVCVYICVHGLGPCQRNMSVWYWPGPRGLRSHWPRGRPHFFLNVRAITPISALSMEAWKKHYHSSGWCILHALHTAKSAEARPFQDIALKKFHWSSAKLTLDSSSNSDKSNTTWQVSSQVTSPQVHLIALLPAKT